MNLALLGGMLFGLLPLPMNAQATFAPARPTSSINIFAHLHHLRTIGSTVDSANGDQNPYGLVIANATTSKIAKGDLIACNFNDKANIQGNGTTIEVLHPFPGAKSHRLVADPSLKGCAAIALGPMNDIWLAAYTANDNPIVSPEGQIFTTLLNGPWHGPFGQAFSGHPGPDGVAAFYESNALDGSIIRINIRSNGPFTYDKIVAGLDVNHGVPGSILTPSGLTYDASRDTLYIIDGNDVGRVYAISQVSSVRPNGITVSSKTDQCFFGPDARFGRQVFHGPPLNAPISADLLFNGDLVIGNTLDNRLVQLSPNGRVMGVLNVDRGPDGALFGIATQGTTADNTRIYLNDDNDNTIKVLAH